MFGFEKRWQFAAIASEDHLVSAAVAHFGYLGYAFAYCWDRETGKLRKFKHIVPGAVGITVASAPDEGASAFWSPLDAVTFDPVGNRLEVRAWDWRAEIDFDGDAQAFDAAWAIPSAGGHRTRKRMGEGAGGTLWLDGKPRELKGRGLKDWSRGQLARETSWRWAAGAGMVGDKVVAWNLRTGFDDPTEVENAVWVDGEPVSVGRATIEPGGSWRVEAGPLVLQFSPDGEHREDLNLLLLASRYTQPWGRFDGKWDGRPLTGYGVVEDHWARW